MRTLILVKHSLPQIEPNVPARDWRLSPEGRARCTPLAKALAPYIPGAVFCSSEPKARETAQIISGQMVLQYQPVDGLHEHDRTNAPFVPRPEFEQFIREFFRQPDQLVFGQETARQTLQRFRHAVEQVFADTEASCVAVVAHGTVISLFVAEQVGCDPFDLWRQLGLPSFVVLSGLPWQLQKVIPHIP